MSNENPDTAKIFLNLEDTAETQNAMAPGGSDDGFAQDQPAVPQRPKQMNSTPSVASGPAIAALIVLIGGGSIFGMRVVSGQAAISKDAFEMNVTQPVIGADFDQRFQSTMTALEQSTRPVQVPIGYIPRDPFNFSDQESTGIVPVVTDVPDQIDPAERERLRQEAMRIAREAQMVRERQTAMQDALDSYQLQSTLQGPNAVARISGEIVRVGGKLTYEVTHEEAETETSFFTVETIGGRTAVLVAEDGTRYELQIGLPTRQLESVPEPEPVEPEAVETPADAVNSTDNGEPSLFEKLAAAAAAAKQNAESVEDEASAKESEAVESETGEPESVAPEADEAEAVESETGESESVTPEADEAEAVESETGESESVTPEADEAEVVESETDVSESPAAEESAETETGEQPVAPESEGDSESQVDQADSEPVSDTPEVDGTATDATDDTEEVAGEPEADTTPAEPTDEAGGETGDASDDTPATGETETGDAESGDADSGESGSDETGSDETGSDEPVEESGTGESEPVQGEDGDSETGEPAAGSGESGEGR